MRARGYHVAKAPAGKAYSHVVTLRIGPFDVSATPDREVCQYVELPYVKGLASCQRERPDAPETCGLPILGYEIRLGGGISHHFILWAYERTVDGAAKFPPGIHDSQACLDFGPADSLHTRQIGNSQSRRLRALLPEGLGQQIRAVTDSDGTPRAIGLVLNAHYIGAGKPTKGVARVKLFVARPGTIRAYGKLILDVTGSAFHRRPTRHGRDDGRHVGGRRPERADRRRATRERRVRRSTTRATGSTRERSRSRRPVS